MGDIKATISTLCKHINLLFDMKIKPEMVRLAKFNKPSNKDDDIVETFWILLSNMINLSVSEDIVFKVKLYFFKNLKYKSLQFYTLPEDMSDGSRELLIALSYLLSQDYLNKYVKKIINNSLLNPNSQIKINTLEEKIGNYMFNMKLIKTEEDFENALQWIEGRIKYNNKMLLEYNACFDKLSSKLNTNTLTPHSEQLSVPALFALNSVEHAQAFIQDTDIPSKILENHEQWLQTQHTFWEWMNSVLLERQKSPHLINFEDLHKFLDGLR